MLCISGGLSNKPIRNGDGGMTLGCILYGDLQAYSTSSLGTRPFWKKVNEHQIANILFFHSSKLCTAATNNCRFHKILVEISTLELING